MKRLRIFLFVAALTAVAGGSGRADEKAEGTANTPPTLAVGAIPAPAAKELEEFKKETRALYDFKEKAFAEGKADPIVDRFYAANVISAGPDGKPIVGREPLRKEYQEVVQNHKVKIESIYPYVKGDVGWDWTNFRVVSKDGKEPPFTFMILFLWVKQSGHWVSAGDMYVTGEFPAQH